jgi:hypothetical protein
LSAAAFYYNCGRAVENVLSNAESAQEYTDGLIAVPMFEKLISLKENKDKKVRVY